MGLLTSLRAILPACSPNITEGAKDAPPQATLRGPSVEMVRRAVEALPNDERFATRESYRDVGYAIKSALPDDPDEAFVLYLGWAMRWTGGTNDPDVVESDWRRMKGPFRIGWPWLAGRAEELGLPAADGGFTRALEWADFDAMADAEKRAEVEEQRRAGQIAMTAARYQFLTLGQAADRATTDTAAYLVKGLLDEGAASVLYGASNTGKSFLVFWIAFCIASGRPVAGMKVSRGRTVIVAAEGARGALKRCAALEQRYGNCEDFLLLPSGVDLYDPNADLEPLIVAILALGGVKLVVLDTLARVMAGGDENSTKDMTAFNRNIGRLQVATGAHVMLVHHSGKDDTRGARGSGALKAAVDTEIEIKDGLITVTKQRDMDKSWTAPFGLDVVTIGEDQDGDPVTSCIARVDGFTAAEATAATLSVHEREIMQAMRDVGATLEQPAKRAEILSFLPKLKPDTARQYLASLHAKGLVVSPKRGHWALRGVETGSNVAAKWHEEFG